MTQFFTQDTLTFLASLAANNNRDWFTAHKHTYETVLKIPATQFSQVMCDALEAEFSSPYTAKIFRIYRDVRFSKDKTPYNTHLRIAFAPSPKGTNMPAWMMGIETDHLVLGMGIFGFDKAGLERFRKKILNTHGDALHKNLQRLQDTGFRIGEPELKRIPSGFDRENPRAGLLRHKSLTVWKDYLDATAATGPNLTQECLDVFQDMKPVFDWISNV